MCEKQDICAYVVAETARLRVFSLYRTGKKYYFCVKLKKCHWISQNILEFV